MLTLSVAANAALQYGSVGRAATVNAVLATSTAIAAALAGNEPMTARDARKAVYQYLMDSGMDKSTASQYREAGAWVYRALAAKYPTTLDLAVHSDEIGSAVTGLRAAILKLDPSALAGRTAMIDWAKGVCGIRKAEKAEKTLLERVETITGKEAPGDAAALETIRHLLGFMSADGLASVTASVTVRSAEITAAEAAKEAAEEADMDAAETFSAAAASGQPDPMLGLKVA